MMNLKQHNNIVQKLIQQIQSKDKQLTQLNKQLTQQTKTINNQSNKTIQSTQTDKLINKKITQLNKQHQSKLSTINQQLKTLTQQNLQLKQRLNLKTQIQYKQKQRIAQILKKSVVQRKPGSKQDYKISALISHYQEQINKKNIYIQTLKRQIKSSVINNKQELKSINNNNNINNNINNNNNNNNNNSISPSISTKSTKLQESDKNNDQDQGDVLQKRSVSLVEHKKVVQKLNKQIQTVNDILENRNIQLQQLKNNYNQLTKQYYRVVNQYGVAKQFTQTNIKSKQSKNINNNNNNNNRNNTNNTNNNINNNINNNQNIKNTNNTNNKQSNLLSNAMIMMKNNTTSFNKLKQPSFIQTNKSQTNFSFDLSQDITNNNINNDQNQQEDVSISLTFEENFKNFNHRPKLNLEQQQEPQDDHNQNHQPKRNTQKQQRLTKNNQNNLKLQQINKQLKQLQSLISSILQILNISDKQEILPCLNDLAAKTTFLQINQHILSNLHQFLYKFGMGKVSKNQMIQVLNKFQNNCNKWIQANDLLDEICIQIGAKRHKLIQKVNLYKQMQQDYLTKMKAASFLTELNKSQKLLEFIDFFQLDKSNLQLPQQLKNIYQQLKYVDRFIKLANPTLGIQIRDRNGLEQTLQLILKKLEKYYSWEIEIQKENQKRINKKKQKLKENTQQ